MRWGASAAGEASGSRCIQCSCEGGRKIGVLLPNNQRQHRTLHIQKDVLPYALR